MNRSSGDLTSPSRQIGRSYRHSASKRTPSRVVDPHLQAPWEVSSDITDMPLKAIPSATTVPAIAARVQQLFDVENLLEVFKRLRAGGGQAPGPDGIGYQDLTNAEMSRALRDACSRIRNGTYRPAAPRICSISKGGGEWRRLSLNNIVDRVIATRIAEVIDGPCESKYLPGNFGFRRGKGPLDLLARLEHALQRDGRFFVVEDDVLRCFDNMSLNLAMAELKRLNIDIWLWSLIKQFLHHGKETNDDRGIPTGDPLAPRAMNLLLTALVDTRFGETSNALLLRYADNLVLSTRSLTEGRTAHTHLAELLKSGGLQLKRPTEEPRDIRNPENGIQLLGFGMVHAKGELHLTVKSNAWESLSADLTEAWDSEHPQTKAKTSVRGWLAAIGPAVEKADAERLVDRVRRVSAERGFRELGRKEELAESLRIGAETWQRARRRLLEGHRGNLHP